MASWMAHLRIADKLLNDIEHFSKTHFIVGNIAPDSGEPIDGNWNVFSPPTEISHWKLDGVPRSKRAEKFKEKHLNVIEADEAFAFYLGYYTHLLTDYIWSRDIFLPQKEKYASEFEKNPEFIWQIKNDMYDLDHLYYNEYPSFRAFEMFSSVSSFPNIYLEYFSKSAFENKIKYITNFYKNFEGKLDREYSYFTKSDMDRFVETAVNEIRSKLLLVVEKAWKERQARIYPIILSEYNAQWTNWYTEEKENLLGLVGKENIALMSHYGSTSVPGLMAKPTVDILLEIKNDFDIEKLIAVLPQNIFVCAERAIHFQNTI